MKNLSNILKTNLIIVFLITMVLGITACKTQTVNSKDGVEISYEVSGKGPLAIVFVHGWSCDKSYWNKQFDYFSTKYLVIAIDLAGHGESGLERKNYTMDAYGEDVAAVVNRVKPEKVLLVGHSMGGSVILSASTKIKSKVIGLIGADTFHDLGAVITDKQKEMYIGPLKKDFKKGTYNFVLSMFPKNADQALVKKIATDMSMQPAKIGISSMQNLFDFSDNAAKLVKSIKVPIKSINADLWPTNITRNKKLSKSYSVKLMKGIGHFVAQEDSNKFNSLLEEYINELN